MIPMERVGPYAYMKSEQFGTQSQTRLTQRHKRIIIGAIITAVVGYQLIRSQVSPSECIDDLWHRLTAFFNERINSNHNFGYALEIIGQLCIDIEFIFLLYIVIRRARTFEVHSWMVIFYAIRAFFVETLRFPYTHGHFWEQPPVPSLMVPYGRSRDYFYSGHTGYMVFGAIYFYRMGVPSIMWFNIIGLFIVVFVLISTRVHYSIDIIAGAVMSAEVVWLVGRLMPWLDAFWSIPYKLFLYFYGKLTNSENK